MDGRQRAASAVAARRGGLDMTQRDLAAAAGVDPKTVGNLETGGRWPNARTRARLERALGWPPGEMDRIAATAPDPLLQPQDAHERVILSSALPRDDKRQMIASYRDAKAEAAARSRQATDEHGGRHRRESLAS